MYFVGSNSQDTALDYNTQHAEKMNMTPNSKQKNGFILLVSNLTRVQKYVSCFSIFTTVA